MRKVHIVIATVSGLLIGFSVAESAAQPADNAKAAPAGANAGNDVGISSDNPDATVARQPPQEERPFLCFGDAACEREMARQKRAVDPMPLRPGAQRRDSGSDEGPLLQGIPGQTEIPGLNLTPAPTVPAN